MEGNTDRNNTPIISLIPTYKEMTFLSLSRRFCCRVYAVLNARTSTILPVTSRREHDRITHSPAITGCTSFSSSRAFMSTGMPSENVLIPSLMALPKSVCSATAIVAFITGMNGVSIFPIATASPRNWD
jgi:hypothetical protein